MNAAAQISWRQRLARVLFFFPLQLLLLHFKKNLFLLFFWIILFGYTLNYLAARYGVAYQFLFPEYMGENSPFAFAMVGFALGGFILALNLYTYILHGFRFPFIATLNRPFLKFSVNNFILPASFVLTYMVSSITFQRDQELLSGEEILFNMFGFVMGILSYLIVSLVYFRFTNKNLLSYETKEDPKKLEKRDEEEMVRTNLHRKVQWTRKNRIKREWRVETYLSSAIRIKLARSAEHYNHDLLQKVFAQNHLNASLFELALVVSFILIGSLRENPYFVLPAAASVMFFFTMMLMLISALHSWIRGWTVTVFALVFVLINFSMPELGIFHIENHAYGLDYEAPKAEYSRDYIASLNTNDSIADTDFNATIEMLDNWRRKHLKQSIMTGKKPKLVIVNVSGGGSRSALWTFSSLQYADSAIEGGLIDRAALISGSSGGMIGAAYLRELCLLEKQGVLDNRHHPRFRDNIGKDLLNPVIFTIATNDFFVRYQDVEFDGRSYTKDRAWAFEKQLNSNTEQVMNKRLSDYVEPERQALIPTMIFAPTITNDGRRLLISSQPCSYLTQNKPEDGVNYSSVSEDVEYLRLFDQQDPLNLRFTSALRMNATFPYVLPIVTLPSDPPVEVMDAGMRDNFGMKTTLQFLYTFRNWINTNTSGVVIVQVRDLQRDSEREQKKPNLFNRITLPLGSIYGNITRTQDYNNDQLIRYMSALMENDLDIVTLQLAPDEESAVSLSFHLTNTEKTTINQELQAEDFQQAVEELKRLLE
ncbi:MAG: hypothetical protein MK081_14255 [Flavobacteriales bacterium]|nr:hypothetical protein [Flavobacteriales bacterium]